MKKLIVRNYYALSNQIYKLRKAGYTIESETSGKRYIMTHKDAEPVEIVKEALPEANNKILLDAIAIFDKSVKEANTAIKATEDADKKQREAFAVWDQEIDQRAKERNERKFLTLKECDDMESWKAYKAADEATKKARQAERVAIITREAAKANAAKAAAEVIREAMTANPEKFTAPADNMKFLHAISEAVDSPYISIKTEYSSIYVEFYKDYQSAREFLTDRQSDGTADAERIAKRAPLDVLDYKTIKAEAKKAIKDAEKIEAIQKAACAKVDAIQAGYKSNIKYMLPSVDQFPRDRGTI